MAAAVVPSLKAARPMVLILPIYMETAGVDVLNSVMDGSIEDRAGKSSFILDQGGGNFV